MKLKQQRTETPVPSSRPARLKLLVQRAVSFAARFT